MGSKTKRGVVDLVGAALLGAVALTAAAQDRPFRTMTEEDEREQLCEIPAVPADLAYTNAENDAYQYWREKLEWERRLSEQECNCDVEVVTWQEVVQQAEPWIREYQAQPIRTGRKMEKEIQDSRSRVERECIG